MMILLRWTNSLRFALHNMLLLVFAINGSCPKGRQVQFGLALPSRAILRLRVDVLMSSLGALWIGTLELQRTARGHVLSGPPITTGTGSGPVRPGRNNIQ